MDHRRDLPDGSSDQVNHLYLSWWWIAHNSVYYLGMASKLFGIYYGCEVLFGLSLPFLVLGIKARWRQDYHFLAFSALNQLLYTVWPGRGDMRDVIPMMPFYLYFIFQGAYYAFRNKSTMPDGRKLSRLGKISINCARS